jgi:hypothetical protein
MHGKQCYTLWRDEKVIGFDIPVKNPVLMTRGQRCEEGLHEAFDVRLVQPQGRVFDDLLQVMLQKLQHLNQHNHGCIIAYIFDSICVCMSLSD